jgi:hypothetical protein
LDIGAYLSAAKGDHTNVDKNPQPLKEKEIPSIEKSLGGNSSKGEEDEESKGNREPKETSMGPPTHSSLSGLVSLVDDNDMDHRKFPKYRENQSSTY